MKKIAALVYTVLLIFLGNECLFGQANFTPIDNWLAGNVSKMGGRAILVIYKDGQIIYNHAENELSRRQKLVSRFIARRQGKTANTDDYTSGTRQMIASCSKWYSAALVMSFVDEGRLALTDTVGKFLPVLSAHGKGNITISECLSHTTAIQAPDMKESLQDMRKLNSMDEAIAEIADMPMEGEPGKVFHYSNVGLQIAGAVIEKISGKSFETLFSERIARPLEMKNTDFGKGKVALPAGGAGSTPDDYIHFLVMILNKGTFHGKRILSEKAINEMQVNRLDPSVKIAYSPAEAGDFGYGFGEWVMESSSTTKISTAVTSPGLFGSFPWVDNNKKYCAFLMTFYVRSDGRNQRYKELKKLVDEAIR
jgi:CubicO group peptidase (beta-lactamase class C family)